MHHKSLDITFIFNHFIGKRQPNGKRATQYYIWDKLIWNWKLAWKGPIGKYTGIGLKI